MPLLNIRSRHKSRLEKLLGNPVRLIVISCDVDSHWHLAVDVPLASAAGQWTSPV